MKSDHAVVFIEISKSRITFLKTSEKFDFIKSHATRFMTPAESDLKNLIKTSEKIDFIKDTSEGFYESGEVWLIQSHELVRVGVNEIRPLCGL